MLKLAEECGKALHEIVDLAEATADQVRDVAKASDQQSTTSEEFTLSITQASVIAEETTQTQQLSSLITDLKKI